MGILNGAQVKFWASPTSISAGQSSTLNWEVSGIRAFYLNGQGLTGPTGSRVVSPSATTTYTFKVIFVDGSSQDYPVTVTVGGGGPIPPIPPEWQKYLLVGGALLLFAVMFLSGE